METFKVRLGQIKAKHGLSDEQVRKLAKIGGMSIQKFVFIESELEKLRLLHAAQLVNNHGFIKRLTVIWNEANILEFELGKEVVYQ